MLLQFITADRILQGTVLLKQIHFHLRRISFFVHMLKYHAKQALRPRNCARISCLNGSRRRIRTEKLQIYIRLYGVWLRMYNVYADFFDRRRRRAGALTPPEVGVGAEDCRMSVAKYFSDWGCGKRPQPQLDTNKK